MEKGRLGYGGSVAGPSFQRIGKQMISYLGLKPEGKKEIARTELAAKFKKSQAL